MLLSPVGTRSPWILFDVARFALEFRPENLHGLTKTACQRWKLGGAEKEEYKKEDDDEMPSGEVTEH